MNDNTYYCCTPYQLEEGGAWIISDNQGWKGEFDTQERAEMQRNALMADDGRKG